MTTDELMAMADVYANAYHSVFTNNGGIQWADTLVAKEKKNEFRAAIQTALDEARAEERERCAKMCENIAEQYRHRGGYVGDLCAAALRKEPTP